MRNALSYTIVFVALTMPATAARAQEPFVAVHDFHITEGGGILPPVGGACSIDVKGARAAFTILDDQWTAAERNHRSAAECSSTEATAKNGGGFSTRSRGTRYVPPK